MIQCYNYDHLVGGGEAKAKRKGQQEVILWPDRQFVDTTHYKLEIFKKRFQIAVFWTSLF